jgi:hypothetical protein
VSNIFHESIPYCTSDLNVLNEDSDPYDIDWSPLPPSNNPTPPGMNGVSNAFQYTKALSISSFPYSAVYTTYLGGGYVYKMNGNASDVISDLTLLEQNNWIDRQTRAVFVEFSVFNPNLNMFAHCYIAFEFLPTGSIVTSYRFSPMSLFDSRNDLYSFGTICAILYLVMIFVLTMKQIYNIKVHKLNYFKRAWSYLDIALIAFSYATFAVWLYRLWEAQKMMNKLTRNFGVDPSKHKTNNLKLYLNLKF